MAWLTLLTELIAGLAILLGAFVPLVSLPLARLLFVAILNVHLPFEFCVPSRHVITKSGKTRRRGAIEKQTFAKLGLCKDVGHVH
jgi:putative oxidoreductase